MTVPKLILGSIRMSNSASVFDERSAYMAVSFYVNSLKILFPFFIPVYGINFFISIFDFKLS
jgi:hypothetical protein